MEKPDKRVRDTYTLHPGALELLALISEHENRAKSRTVENLIKQYAKSHPSYHADFVRIFGPDNRPKLGKKLQHVQTEIEA